MRFPPRMTPTGERISLLPVARAEAALAALARTLGASDDAVQRVLSGGSRRAPRPIAHPRVNEDAPTRRTLTEEEMSRVELGGADP
jgi:hypothetical protein